MQIDGESERLIEDKKKIERKNPQTKISCTVEILKLNPTSTFSNDVLKQPNNNTEHHLDWSYNLLPLHLSAETWKKIVNNCKLLS